MPLPALRRAAALVLIGAALTLAAAVASRSALVAPETTVLFLDRRGRFLGEAGGWGGEIGFWRVGALPGRVVAATLAVEDRRFRRHPGVDPVAVGRAALRNIADGRRSSGASTVAMQVARLQRPGARTLPRKALEALTAVALTARHGREAVLAQYLRLAPYGNRIRGIAYAARRYLDKPVADLSWAEVAFLTAIPQAPGRMNPYRPDGRARAVARGRRILALLRADGALGPAEHDLAQRQIGELAVPPLPRRPESTLHAVAQLTARLAAPGARARLPDPPLLVTSLDLDLQEEVAWTLFGEVGRLRADGAGNAAALVIDRADGAVLAWAGSAGYFDAAGSGAIDFAAVARPAGSTLKPFLYALSLDRGTITPATVLEDAGRGPGGVENADLEYLGPLLPRAALATSRNVPAVVLQERVGRDAWWSLLGDLGLHDGSGSARRWGSGLAIGALPVTLERLTTAYAALAGDGLLRAPAWVAGAPPGAGRRVFSEEAARLVTLFLADPMARLPAFPRMGASEYPFPVAVKTGTSAGCRDAWTVAASARAVVGVWVGRADFRPMRGVTGFGAAAGIARRVLAAVHADQLDGLADLGFPPPRGYRSARLCARTGLAAGDGCDRVSAEWLRPGDAPAAACAGHGDALAPRVAALPPRPPTAPAPRVRIRWPEEGASFLADPEAPPGTATIPLEAVADPAAAQLVWLVDGRPYRTVDRPFTARWALEPGSHVFQARLADIDAVSAPVRIRVQ